MRNKSGRVPQKGQPKSKRKPVETMGPERSESKETR